MTQKALVFITVLGVVALALVIAMSGEAGTSNVLGDSLRCLTCHALPGL